MGWFSTPADRLTLRLHIQPSAKKTECVGLYGDYLKIRLAAPPVDGKANTCLLRSIAGWFAEHIQQVQLKSSETSRQKTVIVNGSLLDPLVCLANEPIA